MARKELIQYIDDLDGNPLRDNEVVVVRFGYKGRNYYLDLSEANAATFDELLKPYVDNATLDESAPAGTRGPRRGANPNSSRQRERNRIIRQWAKDHGKNVADRGALPKWVIDEYEATHS